MVRIGDGSPDGECRGCAFESRDWKEVRSAVPFTRSFWPRLMLRAFAIECLIKAHCLSKKKLCSGGEYVGVVRYEKHDLQKLALHTDITLSADEADMLDRLSAVAVGTRSISDIQEFQCTSKTGSSELLRVEWAHPKDEFCSMHSSPA